MPARPIRTAARKVPVARLDRTPARRVRAHLSEGAHRRRRTIPQPPGRDQGYLLGRIDSYRTLSDTPVVVTFGGSLTDALAGWHTALWRGAGTLALLSACSDSPPWR